MVTVYWPSLLLQIDRRPVGIVGMKRRLGRHGNVVARPAPPRSTRRVGSGSPPCSVRGRAPVFCSRRARRASGWRAGEAARTTRRAARADEFELVGPDVDCRVGSLAHGDVGTVTTVRGVRSAQCANRRGRCPYCDVRQDRPDRDAPHRGPGVGPVAASAFVGTIDDITRFRTAHELEAYLGMVPSERSSGEKRQLGHITQLGQKYQHLQENDNS